MMQQLSSYISSALKKPLPLEVTERAKLHLVDTFAAMISGSRLLPGKKALTYVKSLGGKPEVGLVGTSVVTSVLNAALANGMFGHADETDDIHTPTYSHPGSGVVPAALAIGERDRIAGREVLRAIVLGYDICARILFSLDAVALRTAGRQATSFGAVFGAAAAAGSLLKLNEREVRFMLSYAAQQTAGLYCVHRDTQHIEKSFAGVAMGVRNGTAAALMVEHGFTGVEDVFSGERNFFFTFAPKADPKQFMLLTQGLGRDFAIMRSAIKRWPAGGSIQGSLHVLQEMIQRHGFKVNEVERLVVRIPQRDVRSVNNRDMPDDCIQHLLAVMLLDGTLTFKSAHDYSRMKDPKVMAVRKRVELVGDESLTDPLQPWRCVMEIILKERRKLSHRTMSAKGGFDDPLSRQEMEEKALDLIVPVLGKSRSRKLLNALWEFDRINDIRSLRRLASA
ncbi:MAG: MmgE/PrpD family protein [Betaproteobacteria bacterium]|nr:MmgE/PrpD family protein [Betaproteobacteria bacterium]